MKKVYLFIFACTCFYLAKATNPVPNSSFENWTSGNPDNWNTDNSDGFACITQTSPGYNSTYAAKGKIALFLNNTRPPVLEALGSGNGFPVTQNYNNFECYYKTNLVGSESFIASVIIKDSNHNIIGAGVDSIVTSDTGYTKLDIDITYLNGNAATSAIITFSMTENNSDTVSYFIVDDVSLNIITGIENISAENNIHVFPIPAHEWLTIKGQIDNTKPFQLMITDATGQAAIERKSKTPSCNFIDEKLNLSGIAPGIYFLMLASDECVLTKRIVIQ